MTAIPRWLTDEHAITLATWALVVVTFLLVIATVLLWIDSWRRGIEERERWKVVDERYLAENRPRCVFTIETSKTERPLLRCLNLGSSAFEVDRIEVRMLPDGAPETFSPRKIVQGGHDLAIAFPEKMFSALLLRCDLDFAVQVSNGVTKVRTSWHTYCLFFPDRGRVAWVKQGLHETRFIKCPICGARDAVEPAGIASIDRWHCVSRIVEDKLAASCPSHNSIKELMIIALRETEDNGDA